MTDQITGLPVAGSTIGTAAKGQKAPVAAAEVGKTIFSCLSFKTTRNFREVQQMLMTI